MHPVHRRTGLGSAISAALTVELLHEFDLVTLGVVAGNDAATRIYQRLGYQDVVPVTSLRPTKAARPEARAAPRSRRS